MNHQRSHNRRAPSNKPSSSIPQKRTADEAEDAWVAEEDKFVLRQAKRKAILRVRGGRARPIDWLAVTLRAVDASQDQLDEHEEDGELEVVDPEGVFEGLDRAELEELAGDIDTYLVREMEASNKEYWRTMKIICKDRLDKLSAPTRTARGVGSVTSDVDRMFSNKSLPELEKLERQIRSKLDSNEDIDVDYWEHLLRTLLVWKAKASLRKVSREVVQTRLRRLQKELQDEASKLKASLEPLLQNVVNRNISETSRKLVALDPDPSLKLRPQDKGLEVIDEKDFLTSIQHDRQRVLKLGYVPMSSQRIENSLKDILSAGSGNRKAEPHDPSTTTSSMYEREVARGVDDDEEVFAGEEDVVTASKSQWSSKYRPRKPQFFNRVQMGYEWNKYNQTHYDQDNPPPKVVQGYKFNVFYPELIDKNKAPNYKIERDDGRKRGQTLAPAGEEDTCLIRFTAGPPYEDIAFRIVDREWDYSARRDRGFKSSFEKGILQLHFQFKKIYYRK